MTSSTTVEIILYYLTSNNFRYSSISTTVEIILYYLTYMENHMPVYIYNSRNYSILLNYKINTLWIKSTTVEIILYYLTSVALPVIVVSTTVEIILYYLTRGICAV